MTTQRRAISLHIERLVVDGLPLTEAQAARLQASVERELARLIAERGDPGAWGGADAGRRGAPAPVVRWDAARPHQLGRALAGGVLASLDRRSQSPGTAAHPGEPHGASPHEPSRRGRS